MNCKQCELVRYAGRNPLGRPNVYGWIGRTIAIKDWEGEPSWIVDPPLPGGDIRCSLGICDGNWVSDRVLRPIRGDESKDETTTTRELESA